MRILFLTVLGLVLITNVTFAQKPDSTKSRAQTTNDNQQRTGFELYQMTGQIVGDGAYTMVQTVDTRFEGTKGSPYFLPAWSKGQIEVVSGKHYRDVPIKFDVARQSLLLLRPQSGNDSIIVNANQVKSFQFTGDDGQFYFFRRFPTANTSEPALKDSYFLVLYQNKSALLKRITKTLKKADYKNPYSADIRYDEYVPSVSYYLLKPDQTLAKVKLADKAIIDALGDHKNELEAFVKEQNLKVKTESDAIKLVKQYDTF